MIWVRGTRVCAERAHPRRLNRAARVVGVSRSALVERFSGYLSEPPMAYLTAWRLRLAARALTTTPRGVAEIAADVGYESEAAFNRAFNPTELRGASGYQCTRC